MTAPLFTWDGDAATPSIPAMYSPPGALLLLSRRLDRGEIGGDQFLEQSTRALTQAVGCDRAGIWLFVDPPRRRLLRCLAMHDATLGRRVTATDMDGTVDGAYFDELTANGIVSAEHARSHPALRPFLDDYLLPNDVHSVLDTLISLNGVPVGIFSCEQVGSPKPWTGRQLQLLRAVGPRMALSLVKATSRAMDTAPGAMWEPTDLDARLTRLLSH